MGVHLGESVAYRKKFVCTPRLQRRRHFDLVLVHVEIWADSLDVLGNHTHQALRECLCLATQSVDPPPVNTMLPKFLWQFWNPYHHLEHHVVNLDDADVSVSNHFALS